MGGSIKASWFHNLRWNSDATAPRWKSQLALCRYGKLGYLCCFWCFHYYFSKSLLSLCRVCWRHDTREITNHFYFVFYHRERTQSSTSFAKRVICSPSPWNSSWGYRKRNWLPHRIRFEQKNNASECPVASLESFISNLITCILRFYRRIWTRHFIWLAKSRRTRIVWSCCWRPCVVWSPDSRLSWTIRTL